MRRLLLLRHAKAERSEPGTKDHSRVLIDRGRKDAAKIGTYMGADNVAKFLDIVAKAG